MNEKQLDCLQKQLPLWKKIQEEWRSEKMDWLIGYIIGLVLGLAISVFVLNHYFITNYNIYQQLKKNGENK